MACKRFQSGDGTRQVDIISQLEGVPHVLEEIFHHVDIATIRQSVNVSTTWKRLINSLNLWKCVWKKNLKMSPTWRTLSTRMEHLQPQLWDRMKKCDASSYREAFRYVEGNVRQISQSAKENLYFQTVFNAYFHISIFRMNDKYVFTNDMSQVLIYNRWTRQLVKHFRCGYVLDMQLNDRFLVVRLSDEIVVYDVQKLECIQKLEIDELDCAATFCLGLDVVFIYEKRMHEDHLEFGVHRWNASAARFFRDTETEERLKVTFVDFNDMSMYVDEKFLILDFYIWADYSRLIQIFSLETMQLIRERKFGYNSGIRAEYHDGGIVVHTFPADGRPSCVALWDVDKDTVQPIADHPSRFVDSFTMTHHPFQIVVTEGEDQEKLLLLRRGQPTKNSLIDMSYQHCVHCPFTFPLSSLYFDGVQMIAISENWLYNGRREIEMADLVG